MNVTLSIFPDIKSRDTTLTTQTGEIDEIVSKSADTRAHDSSVTDTIVGLYFYCETGYIFSLMIAGYDRLLNRRIVNKVTFTARYLTASSTDRDEMENGKEQNAVKGVGPDIIRRPHERLNGSGTRRWGARFRLRRSSNFCWPLCRPSSWLPCRRSGWLPGRPWVFWSCSWWT